MTVVGHDRDSTIGPRASTGHVGQTDHDQGDAREQDDEQRAVGGQGAGACRRRRCWAAKRPARPSTSTIGTKRPSSMQQPSSVFQNGVPEVSPPKAEPLLLAAEVTAYTASDRPCGPLSCSPARPVGRGERDGAADEHQDRGGQHVAGDQHDLALADLLAEVLRGAADHQAAEEHGDDGEHEHPVEAGADAAGRDLAEHHVEHRDAAAGGGQRVVHRVDRAGRGAGGGGGEQRGRRRAEAHLLALHRAAGQLRARCRARPSRPR